jgi:hypothetical protein
MASKKTPGAKAKKGTGVRHAKRTTAKKAAKKSASYNPQTGKLSGRESKADARLKKLTARYQSEGMELQDARQRALAEMRSHHGRGDWRHG